MKKDNGRMGFKQSQDFNLVMLGKQGWKLSTNQDTIVYKVLKVKYFPSVDLLDAKQGHNPSFV